jgi:hypothetical protein
MGAAGLVVLLAQAITEVRSDPAVSLVDAYWVGRQPWTGAGVALAIIGSTITVVGGTAAVWLAGGPWRRAGSAIALAVAAFWWFLAMLPTPRAVPCDHCSAPGPDPVAMAYSLPVAAALLLLLPAVVVGAIALLGPRDPRGIAPSSRTS